MIIDLDRVYTMQLINGSEIVAKITEESDKTYTVSNPLTAIPDQRGLQMVFGIFTANPRDPVTINKSAVVLICATREEVCDAYLETTTGIKPVRNSKIIMG